MSRPTPALGLALVAAALALAAYPWFGDEYYVDLAVRLMILGIFAMSLDLLIGFTGLVSFGHAAFFGLAGYLLAFLTPESGQVSVFVALPVALAGTALFALATGWLAVRTSGIYFIMITLAFAQMLYFFFNENARFGSSDGIYVPVRPAVAVGPLTLLDLGDATTFYYVVLAALVLTFLLLATVLNAPFGRVIRAIRANEARARALGFATRRYKLVSYVIAGTIAGLAGFLEATHTGFMSPGHLSWHESGLVLMIVLLGGMGTLYGPVIGAFAIGLLQDQLQDLTEHWLLAYGVFVIAVVLFLPAGIAGLVERLTRRTPESEPGP